MLLPDFVIYIFPIYSVWGLHCFILLLLLFLPSQIFLMNLQFTEVITHHTLLLQIMIDLKWLVLEWILSNQLLKKKNIERGKKIDIQMEEKKLGLEE